MAGWQKIIKSGSNAELNRLYVGTSVTASHGFSGSLSGTASFATSASFAISASWAPGGVSVSASYAITSSYADNANLYQIATSQISSNTHNYDPAGFSTAKIVYLSFDSTSKGITGFASGSAGMVKWFINTGSYLGYFPSQHPSSSAANRIYGEVDHLLPPGGCIHVLYNSFESRWMVTYNSFDVSRLGHDGKGLFYSQMPGSTNQSDHPFLGFAVAGTGAGNLLQDPSGSFPVSWELDTGTTAGGDSTIYLIKNSLAFDSIGSSHIGAWALIYIQTLSTAAQRFRVHFNILPTANSTTEHLSNSCGWRYCDNSSSGAWEYFTRNSSGVETTGSSGITVATNTLYLCRTFMPIDLSEVRFHITDGVNIFNTISTENIPSSVAVGVRVSIHKVAGTTSRFVRVSNIGAYALKKY